VTSTPFHVVIRPPVLLRGYVVAFLLVWVGAIAGTVVARGGAGTAAVGVVFILFGPSLSYRFVRLGVSSSEDGTLLVRSNLGTRLFRRSDIEQFRLGVNGGSRLGERSIQALLSDGTTYRLDVTRSPLGLSRRKNAQRLADLTRWLESPA
jgi:hypothetical protein